MSDELKNILSSFLFNVNLDNSEYYAFKKELEICYKKISKILNFNKVKIQLQLKYDCYQSNKNLKEFILFDDNINSNNVYEYSNKFSNYANVKILYYSKKQFNQEQINDLRKISDFFFKLFSNYVIDDVINYATLTDFMVDAPNLAGLYQYGGILKTKNELQNYTVIYLNLKDFKFINKLVGSESVNDVVKKYVDSVKNVLENSELIGRLGGDNFVIYARKENITNILDYLKEIKIETFEKTIPIKCRAGIYEVGEKDTVNEAFECASIALAEAKKIKKTDFLFFDEEMQNRLMLAKEICFTFMDDLKNEKFDVFYQPKVNVLNNIMCGTEALVRWTNQTISPGIFVPILENENLIEELDLYVLEHICKDILEFINNGLEPVKISTNISKNNLKDPNLAKKIITIINKYNIDPSYLDIEITETASAENFEDLVRFISEIKKYGLTVSIDDFGIGTSSLNLLKCLDVDTIKIDKSFIDNFENPREKIIIKNIVNMINELDIGIIAEGVEIVEQVDFLKEIGCNYVQGYLFDKPLKKEDYYERLKVKKYEKVPVK